MKISSSAIRICIILCAVLLSSCKSRKEIAYFQNIETLASQTEMMDHSTKIKPNDLLSITVSALDPIAARPYNLFLPTVQSSTMDSARPTTGYLVDSAGNIEFAGLGTLQVAGLSRKKLHDLLEEKISAFVIDPIININITNFKITVLGEVSRPGQYQVSGERVTLPEALGLAGDLTIYGKRDNVLVLRDNNGIKEYKYIDLTKIDVLTSDYYYLHQNDVVYVEPNNSQVQASGFNRSTGIYFSAASLLLSIFVLIIR